jgi:hypothetical protein
MTEKNEDAAKLVRSDGLLASPCPFCGSNHAHPDENSFCVICPGCGAHGPDFNCTDDGAIAAWNHRANNAEAMIANTMICESEWKR